LKFLELVVVQVLFLFIQKTLTKYDLFLSS